MFVVLRKYVHRVLFGTPVSVSTSVFGLTVPVTVRRAPSGFTEFAQPLPSAPSLPQGQGVIITSDPSPKQNAVPGSAPTSATQRLSVTVTLPGQSVNVSS